jgi:hypothetical protein
MMHNEGQCSSVDLDLGSGHLQVVVVAAQEVLADHGFSRQLEPGLAI